MAKRKRNLAAVHCLVTADQWTFAGGSANHFAAAYVTVIGTVFLSLFHLLLGSLGFTHKITKKGMIAFDKSVCGSIVTITL